VRSALLAFPWRGREAARAASGEATPEVRAGPTSDHNRRAGNNEYYILRYRGMDNAHKSKEDRKMHTEQEQF
jgi:hypothetical protein